MRRVAAFGEAGEGALEGMAVRVDQARQHRAGERLDAFGRGDVGRDLGPAAVGAGAEQHTLAPARRRARRAAPTSRWLTARHPISVPASARSTGNTVAARVSS